MEQFYNGYYDRLQAAFDGKIFALECNSDRRHNAVIMCFMLQNSSKILMYCGQMSVFKEEFYKKIEEDYPGSGAFIQQKLEESLEIFFKSDDAKLEIILEEDTNQIGKGFCWPKWNEYLKNGQIEIYSLPNTYMAKTLENHRTVSDRNMYRLETDKVEHNAMCCFYDDNNKLMHEQKLAVLLSHAVKISA